MNIVILDGYSVNPGDLSWDPVAQHGHLTVYQRTAPQEVLQRAAQAHILLTNKNHITAQHMEQLPQLRYIGVLATGYNVVDIQAATARHITVCNIPAYSTMSVAQMAFAHLLNITNRVEHYHHQTSAGQWCTCPDFCYWDTPLTELAGRQMGIVGLGHTGMATARIALAFGMRVVAYTSKPQQALPQGITRCSMEELLRTSDVVSLHCPLTEKTHELINRTTLAMMQPHAILINTGRGPLINEAHVAEALHQQQLAAYAADVLSTEPPSPTNPLLSAPNAYITPHIAWATPQARQRLIRTCADNIAAFLQGKPQNVVNAQ